MNAKDQTADPLQSSHSTKDTEKIRPKLVRSKGSLVKAKPPNILVYSDSIVSRDCVIATLKDIVRDDT